MKFLKQILISSIIAIIGFNFTLNITHDPIYIWLGGWLSCCAVDIIFVIIKTIGELLAEVDPFDNKKLYLKTIKRLKEELKVDEQLLNEHNKLLKSIPGCNTHGNECIPGAIKWVAMAQHKGFLLEEALIFLTNLDGYEDWDKEKWRQFFEDKIF